uniref:Uncharacterized protein n=1 Tax=Salix viminalis TaxID=40686 RepID=A0A6N2M948_SALVM
MESLASSLGLVTNIKRGKVRGVCSTATSTINELEKLKSFHGFSPRIAHTRLFILGCIHIESDRLASLRNVAGLAVSGCFNFPVYPRTS